MKKYLFAVVLLLLVAGGGIFWKSPSKPEQKTLQEVLHRASLNVHTRWGKGDDEGKWREGKLTCEGILGMPVDTHSHYLRCNPNFLSCWYRYHDEVIYFEGERYSFKVHFPSEGKAPFDRREGALLASIEGHGGRLKISLLDTCNEVWLPAGYYGYGQYSSPGEDWRWDNIDRDIFIDKFLVSRRDIWEWRGMGAEADFVDFPSPATALTRQQMEDYCAWKGKQLAQSHIFDAATFHPRDVADLTPVANVRGNYPWTSERMVLDEVENFSSAICLRMLDKKCFEREGYQNFSNRSMGWTGISQVLGGVMEAQRNPLHPHKNLMLSSFYYPHYSPANELARRGRWYGKGHGYSDFNFQGYSPEEILSSYKVGFRCMRQRGNFSPVILDTPAEDFAYAFHLDYNQKIGDKILSEPRGVWHRILKGGKRCLFYKTPYKSGGEIRLGDDCSNAYSNPILFQGVKDFIVRYKDFKTILEFGTVRNHHLEFFHFNVQKNLPFKRYDSPVNKSYRTGILLGWPLKIGKKGRAADNYKNGSARLCHGVNQDCQNELEYSCDRCRFGFFEVLDFKCPQGGSKYCGRDRCGEMGQPACLRGFRVNGVVSSSCVDGWKAGFCQQGLRSVCDEKGVLVCSH